MHGQDEPFWSHASYKLALGNDNDAYATSIGQEDKWTEGGFDVNFGDGYSQAALDKTKDHLVVFYFRIDEKDSAEANARVYFGPYRVNDLNVCQSNPYFKAGAKIEDFHEGDWYVAICHILNKDASQQHNEPDRNPTK